MDQARRTFVAFDAWTRQSAAPVEITSRDVAAAAAFIRGLELTLRAPDAIHIAIAQRLGADLLTFDDKMAAAARALGTTTVPA